jgi:hypothetical protein
MRSMAISIAARFEMKRRPTTSAAFVEVFEAARQHVFEIRQVVFTLGVVDQDDRDSFFAFRHRVISFQAFSGQ